MSGIEDRLRAELWAQSQRTRAEDLRKLRVPPPERARRPGHARHTRWLAPVAAALAAIGVIVGVRLSVTARPAPPAVPVPPACPGACRPAWPARVLLGDPRRRRGHR